ncbi:MAG: DUF3592 domain-containing protein [Candidatus Hydrogenedentes bacterium]|nr:DUF3592 domain-containing protein [Candidatus Hydrogenedentota bacterium]
MAKRGYNRAEWGVIAVFFILGLAGAGLGGGSFYRGLVSGAWPTAPGTITRSDVETAGTGGRHGVTAYRARVEYAYEVGGESYTGDRLFFGSPERYSETHAHQWANRYRLGAEVAVAYEPAAPENAVLRPGLVWEGATFTLAMAIGGFCLLAVATLAITHGLWPLLRRRERPPEA